MFPPLKIVFKSTDPVPKTSESTTTPIGLNHNILSFDSTLSEPLNAEPTPPKIEKVRTTNTRAVAPLTIIFLARLRKLSAFPHIDFFSLIRSTP